MSTAENDAGHVWRAVGPNAGDLWNQCADCGADEGSTRGRAPCPARERPPLERDPIKRLTDARWERPGSYARGVADGRAEVEAALTQPETVAAAARAITATCAAKPWRYHSPLDAAQTALAATADLLASHGGASDAATSESVEDELRDLWRRALEREGNLASAVADVVWKPTQYGSTEDGDTYAYLVPKGAMHRLAGVAQSNGAHVPVAFRAIGVDAAEGGASDAAVVQAVNAACLTCGAPIVVGDPDDLTCCGSAGRPVQAADPAYRAIEVCACPTPGWTHHTGFHDFVRDRSERAVRKALADEWEATSPAWRDPIDGPVTELRAAVREARRTADTTPEGELS